jgi:translation initiation factor 2 alpha subunit (eIF-2alpha)
MEFEQGDIILCTVEKISGTTVFVNIDGSKKTGSITFSEVSPGRIRNIRDFVVPKKTIVCKILKILPNNLELSLRRVKDKERKEAIEQYKVERSYSSILKTVLKEKTKEIIEKIKESSTIYNFLENAKENPEELEKITGKENSQKILDILKIQKKKTITLKKEIQLSTNKPNGLEIIKNLLGNIKDVEIKYLAAGKYSIKKEENNIKNADIKIKEIFEKIETEAKKENIEIKLKN